MKKYLILFICFILSVGTYAQRYNNFVDLMTERHMLNVIYGEGKSTDYDGSPYDQDEFIEGQAISRSDVVYEDVPLRFNIHSDKLEYKDPDGKIFSIGDPDFFNYFILENTKIINLPYQVGNKVFKSYFKVIEEGKMTLLIKPIVHFEKATEPGAYKEAKPATFKRMDDEIYVKLHNDAAVKITNKKSLIAAMSDKEEMITKFIKENKIRTSKQDDVLKVVKYYNTI